MLKEYNISGFQVDEAVARVGNNIDATVNATLTFWDTSAIVTEFTDFDDADDSTTEGAATCGSAVSTALPEVATGGAASSARALAVPK